MTARGMAVTALAILAVGAAGIGGAALKLRGGAASAPSTGIPTAQVRRGAVDITVTARGNLQGGNPETLTAPMVGSDSLVITFLRGPGEVVNAGDIVLQFDTTQQEYNLREAESDLAEAQQKVAQREAENIAIDEEKRYEVESARMQVRIAELELRRNPVLPALKQRDNQIALEAAQNQLKKAQQDLASRKTMGAASTAIEKAAETRYRMLAETARRNIENMTLKAKTDGYAAPLTNTSNTFVLTTGMTLPAYQVGDTVRPGMPVVQIPDLSNWEAVAKVSELDRGRLAVGQPVSVSIVALAGRTYPGHVAVLGNATGSAWDRKFDCRVALDSAGPELRPGMTANFAITAERLENVLWAPSQAIFENDGRWQVYLQTPAGFTPREIAMVKRSESQVVITGLNEGDRVALSNPSEQQKQDTRDQSAMKALPK